MNKEELLNSGNILYKTLSLSSANRTEEVVTKGLGKTKSFVFKNSENSYLDSYKFVGSKEEVDRDGDIVLLDGIDFKNFINNPVVLWGHDSRSTPIGKVKSVMIDKGNKEAVFDIEFATTEKGKEVESLVKQGILNATSIGFIVKEWDYDESLGAYLFKETELLEISIVNVPANAGALAKKKEVKQKSLSKEEISELVAVAVAEAMSAASKPVEEPEEAPVVNTPEEDLDPIEEPVTAPVVEEEESGEVKPDISEVLERILAALEQKPQESVDPESQDTENPKVTEQESQQTDDDSSDKNPDEDHSDDSPEDTEEESDDVNLVNVEDLEEDTEFSVII